MYLFCLLIVVQVYYFNIASEGVRDGIGSVTVEEKRYM